MRLQALLKDNIKLQEDYSAPMHEILGQIDLNENRFEQALAHYMSLAQIVGLSAKSNDYQNSDISIKSAYMNLGNCFYLMKNYKSAL